MKIVIDIETEKVNLDAGELPKHIWLVVCKEIDSGRYEIFRNVTENNNEFERCRSYLEGVVRNGDVLLGHNILGFDLPVVVSAFGFRPESFCPVCIDTLIISKLIDYPRPGHSIEDYGLEFGCPKGDNNRSDFFHRWSQELEDYCIRDVDICEKIYTKYRKYINDPDHKRSIDLEHAFQRYAVNSLEQNGFAFNVDKAKKLLEKVEADLNVLDEVIEREFPPRLKLIREITPKVTKHGTLSKTDFRWVTDGDLSEYNGGPFCRCDWVAFNPASHKQIVAILNEAGWRPTDRTQSHIDTQRELDRQKRGRGEVNPLDINNLSGKLVEYAKTGWKVNEANLSTLPDKAPSSAKSLAKRIVLEARRRTLTEWINLVWHEIEIEHEQLTEFGIVKKEILIQSGLRGKEANGENTNSTTQIKLEKTTKEIISNIPTGYLSKTLLEWLKSKRVNARFVKETANSTSIIVTGKEQLEGFYAATVIVSSDGLRSTQLKFKIISGRIHGRFNALGAWSHRMNHQRPNTANIPSPTDTEGNVKLLGKEMRQLWRAPKNRLLSGSDAEGIQLRVFAHYINDPEFTDALVTGKKEDKSDPHSLNARVLGSVCKSRAAAKRFIYALLLGAGLDKLSQILNCSKAEVDIALDRLMERYSGFGELKRNIIPQDAKRGWFIGLDGRKVRIPGTTVGERRHLAMSGYLQNGEAVIVKTSVLKTLDKIKELPEKDKILLVNIVHDEVIFETPNDVLLARQVAELFDQSIQEVGVSLNLRCPLKGDGHEGLNWYEIH